MKWDKPRQRDYRRLVFGSQWRMFLIVTAGTLLLLAPTVAVTVGFLSGRIAAIERGVVPAFPIKMLFPIQFGSLALAFAAAFLFNRWYVRRNAQRRIIPGLLDQRHCGACVYPLENAPVENDGCTVCPECGSAWRLPSN